MGIFNKKVRAFLEEYFTDKNAITSIQSGNEYVTIHLQYPDIITAIIFVVGKYSVALVLEASLGSYCKEIKEHINFRIEFPLEKDMNKVAEIAINKFKNAYNKFEKTVQKSLEILKEE